MMTKPFDFWQDHSRQFLEMAFGQERRERVQKPDGYGKRTGDCGDTVEFFLNTEKDRICAISYLTDGCLNTNACANTVAHLAEGRSIEAAWEITSEAVIAHLQTLPAESHHCAELAVGSFYKALADLTEKARRPWKKLYR
ncbi:MAG: iron-sulfur cluster assembly scaffold protein [Desulfobacterales bacterium]